MSAMALARCADWRCRMVHTGGKGGAAPDTVRISSSVGRNARNRLEDVRVIQDALNRVRPADGGPAPPLQVDGLCYGKTLAAIRTFQQRACGFRWPDERVDPNGKTIGRLRDFYVPANPYTMPRVYMMLPQALIWIMAARRVVEDAGTYLRSPTVPMALAPHLALVDKYFHLDQLDWSGATAAIARLHSTFLSMEACIGHSSPLTSPGSGYFQEDPFDDQDYAYTFLGGFTRHVGHGTKPAMSRQDRYAGPNVREDTIFICPRSLNKQSDELYTETIVHELSHFCGPELGNSHAIVDHSYVWMPNFFTLKAEDALETADCYGMFAGEAALGREPAQQ